MEEAGPRTLGRARLAGRDWSRAGGSPVAPAADQAAAGAARSPSPSRSTGLVGIKPRSLPGTGRSAGWRVSAQTGNYLR